MVGGPSGSEPDFFPGVLRTLFPGVLVRAYGAHCRASKNLHQKARSRGPYLEPLPFPGPPCSRLGRRFLGSVDRHRFLDGLHRKRVTPFGHLAVSVFLASGLGYADRALALCLAGAIVPDLIDKPLLALGVVPVSHSVGHSVLAVAGLAVAVLAVPRLRRAARRRVGRIRRRGPDRRLPEIRRELRLPDSGRATDARRPPARLLAGVRRRPAGTSRSIARRRCGRRALHPTRSTEPLRNGCRD